MARLSTTERQEQIIDEAIRIIHEQGYSALSIRELAKSVGISEPAIYRHFDSKEAIILAILGRVEQIGKDIQKQLKQLTDPRQKIEKFIELQLGFLEQNPEITSVIFSEDIFQPNGAVKDKIKALIQGRFQMILNMINQAKSQGLVVDANAEDLATVILGYIRMTVLDWRSSNFAFSLTSRGRRLLLTLDKIVFTP